MNRAETLADRRAYLEGGLTELTCERCAAEVRVRKTSPAHTSVQWTVQATARCPELADRPALVRTCVALRDSIERAVREGQLCAKDSTYGPLGGPPDRIQGDLGGAGP